MSPERGLKKQLENIEFRLSRPENGQQTLRDDISLLRVGICERIDSQTQRWTAALEQTEQSLKTSIGAEVNSSSERIVARVQQNEENLRRLETKRENLDNKMSQVLDHVAANSSRGAGA
jgi:hypothetical protein